MRWGSERVNSAMNLTAKTQRTQRKTRTDKNPVIPALAEIRSRLKYCFREPLIYSQFPALPVLRLM
jgi:hypothetical protein